MPMTFPTGGSLREFKHVPSGSHVAVCYLIVDCGMQPGSDAYPAPKHKLRIQFELPNEIIKYEKDGIEIEGPMTIGNWYTASMNEKATLRKHLESWRGKSFTDQEAAQFDVSAILGKACLLSVIESERGGKTYANITSIGGLPKGYPVPTAQNPLLYYGEDSPAADLIKLPQWLQDKINYQLTGPAPAQEAALERIADFQDDDIPF